MKKILLCLLSIILILLCGCKPNNTNSYLGGDTIAVFGNGRYTIFVSYNQYETKREWSLYDEEKKELIEGDVYNYKEIAPYVYTVGAGGYKKLNYETGECIKSRELEDFTSEDQEILKELERTKYEVSERKNPSK